MTKAQRKRLRKKVLRAQAILAEIIANEHPPLDRVLKRNSIEEKVFDKVTIAWTQLRAITNNHLPEE